ncbi:alginate lyase family protein [Defluviimonas sp. SAOS-178_SWC]|uniref:alginate lyase family protein n=1 Tax=Defluviimonas sp. SAOS-178_SWC TaxID=3121287 RepID=UPI00322217E8
MMLRCVMKLADRLLPVLPAAFLSAGIAGAQEPVSCAAPPDPVISLSFVSRYAEGDENRSTIDPRREAEAEDALKPLDQFIDALADRTESLYSGRIQDREAAANCILDQLGRWAEADALTDLGTETVKLTIGSRYAAFALILWQTLPYAPDHPRRTAILDWLDRRMRAEMSFWSDAPSGAQKGNLRAWAGLAAAAVSVQTDRPELRDWADDSIAAVMCSANSDGSLPQEMGRGEFALHYQLHAIAPLVTAVVLLERQGVPARRHCNDAIHRIVDFAIADLADGARTKAITGVEQSLFNGSEQLTTFQLAWIEQYQLLRKSERLEALARDLRPLIYTKLGGNQTALWRR